MAVENYERSMRRLMERQRKLDCAVGVRIWARRIVAWVGHDDRLGRLRMFKVADRSRRLNLFETGRLARAALGKDALLSSLMVFDDDDPLTGAFRAVTYALPLDLGRTCELAVRHVQARVWCEPVYVRWFDERQLGVGLGVDGGKVTYFGRQFVPVTA